MSLTTEFSSLWAELNPKLAELVAEVAALRASVTTPDSDSAISDLYEAMVAAGQAQERVEAILAEVGRARSRARIVVSERQDEYDDQWRNTMINTRIGEYDSAKEKNARYDAGSIQQLVNLRRAKRMLADVEEAFDYVNIKFRGLSTAARDIDSRMRSRMGEFARMERG
jgi:hypothetical protein